MQVNDLILKLTELRNVWGNVDVEYDIQSSIDNETEIENADYDDENKVIILSAY